MDHEQEQGNEQREAKHSVAVVTKYKKRVIKRIDSLKGHVNRSEDALVRAITEGADAKTVIADLLDISICLWDEAIAWMTMPIRDHK